MTIENITCKLCGAINDVVELTKKMFHDDSGFHMQFQCNHCQRKSNIPQKDLKADILLSFNIMGAIQQNSAVVYLTISDGKLCRRFTNPTDNTVTRTTKENRIVHEEFYRSWQGVITDVRTRESDYGKEWNVTIDDGKEKAILSFKYSSGYASSFLKALPNVDLSKEVTITPSVQEVDGKKRTNIFINQEGRAVKWYYTKDNPNGCPGMKKVKIKGVEQWDDSDMMEFLQSKTAAIFATDPF